ncbi:MAG: site-specific integrase [Bacteroidales bacterium]|nr:site-specific integrase [Bacteroidales bacterium]
MAPSGKASKIGEKKEAQFEKNVKNVNPEVKKARKKKEKLPALFHPEQNFDLLKKKGVSVAVILDTVRPRKNGTSTVRVQIIHKRFSKFYSTKVQMLPEDWQKMIGPKTRGDLKEKKIIIHENLRRALEIIYDLDSFSFEKFDRRFLEDRILDDVFAAYDEYIKILRGNLQYGNANFYTYSRDSIRAFVGDKRLSFKSITVQFLKRYESHMTLNGKSPTTLAMYLRCLRYLYNQAIKEGIVKREDYPFGKGNYEIPQPQNIKKALKLAEIGKIYKHVPDNPVEHFYRDLWLFSYLCNGMNMKDICWLKYSNIHGVHIHFRRAKTINTNRNSKPIDIVISPEVKQIIDRWGNKPELPDSYIFPFLTDDQTYEKKHAIVAQAVQMTNQYIKRVAAKVGIESNITTYTARHSFATVLKRSGVNVTFISDALGHTNIKTTENYLDSFEDEQKKEIAKKLTAW